MISSATVTDSIKLQRVANVGKVGFSTEAFFKFRKGWLQIMSLQLLDAMALFADQMMMVLGGPLVAFSTASEIQFVSPSALDQKIDLAVESHLVGPTTL
jgi:hypothetical protein